MAEPSDNVPAKTPADDGEALRRQVAALLAENEELKQEARSRGDFLQNLAHELATPLTPLVGYLKLLKSGRLGPLAEQQQKVIEAMVGATDRIERSLDNLVDLAAMETGQYRLHSTQLDLSQLVQEIAQESLAKAREKHVRVELVKPERLELPGDVRKLRQAISAVLDNAIRFSPHGGHVLVTAEERDERALVCVFDQGPGIPPEDLNNLLLARGDHHAPGSAGLGLPVARQIIEAHGGHLTLESPPKEQPLMRELFSGTRVSLALPLGAPARG